MTIRLPISVESVRWRDAQQVDLNDMNTAQSHTSQTDAATLNNFFGSGLIPYVPERTNIFDSNVLNAEQSQLVASNNFDGYGITSTTQPTDSSLGAQLEVTLSGSNVFARHTVKVLVLGLDFQGILQYEKYTFKRNEIQVGTKHFARILSLMFENFKGNNNCSRNLGGRIVIKEALPMQVSRSSLMSSQNVEPDIFFRDFKVYNLSSWPNVTVAVKGTIQNAIGPAYSVNTLNITQTWLNKRLLSTDDLTTIYGEKFLATSDNVQKITLLLGVKKDSTVSQAHWYDWSGDIIVTVYPLQTSVSCITDTVPQNAIDFPPEATPVAQLTISQTELKNKGFVLNNVEQPVDFIFSNARIGNSVNSGIVAGQHYMVTMQRSGVTDTGTLFTMTGSNRNDNAKFSFFNGVAWTDVADEDLWYEVWSDAIKVADGNGIDAGNGIYIPKTEENADSGIVEDYSFANLSFINNGQNVINHTIAQAVSELYQTSQDPRTGNSVLSRKISKASISNVTSSTLLTLQTSSDPVVLGCEYDTNTKSSISIDGYQTIIGLANENEFSIINPDANVLGINLIGSKLIPNLSNGDIKYRIYDMQLCTDGYGDVDGDGIISNDDVVRATALIGHGLSNPVTQAAIIAGTISALEIIRADVDGDGTITAADINLINDYIDHQINSFPVGYSFNRLNIYVAQNVGRNDGYYDCSDTQIRVNPYSTSKITIATLNSYELDYYGRPDPVEIQSDPVFTTSPFASVQFRIINENDFWTEDLVKISNKGRLLPCTFTYNEDITVHDCITNNEFSCERRFQNPTCSGGHNDFLVPGNLVMGQGQILDTAGNHWPIDCEINTITLEIPEEAYSDGSIDIFRVFIADKGNGFTVANYPAMKFSDCSLVASDALSKGQVKFGTAIKSYSPNLDGYTDLDGYGVIIDPVVSINMLHDTGVMHFRLANLNTDPTNIILRTRIEVTVYLKKAGWKNSTIEVDYTQFDGLVGL